MAQSRNAQRLHWGDGAAIAASVVSVCAACVYLFARAGLPADRPGLLTATGLALFAICMPATITHLQHKKTTPNDRWYTTDAIVLLGVMTALALLGALNEPLARAVGILLASIGAALFVCTSFRIFQHSSVRPTPVAVGGLALLTIGALGSGWLGSYQTPLFLERLTAGLGGPPDSLFHASISNMIRTYGVAGTGIDGLVAVRYHVGSHALFASLAKLSHVSTLEFYNYGIEVVFLPMLIVSFLSFVAGLRRVYGSTLHADEVLRSGWLWLVIGGSIIGMLPPHLKGLLWQGSWAVTSESYSIAIILALLWSSILLRVPETLDSDERNGWLLTVLVLPLLLAASGFAKVSVMVLLLTALYYIAWRTRRLHNPMVLVGLTAATLLAAVTMRLVQSPGRLIVAPLDFLRFSAQIAGRETTMVAALAFLPVFLLGHWMFTIAYLSIRQARRGAEIKDGAPRLRYLDLEVLMVVAVVGLLPGLTISIPGGSAGYFSDVQRYLAAALILGRYVIFPFAQTRSANGVRRAAASVATFTLAAAFATSSYGVAHLAVTDIRNVRNALSSRPESVGGIAGSPLSKTISALGQLGEKSHSWKRETVIYVPRDNVCWTSPDARRLVFLAPAVSGIAEIGGLPEFARTESTYGYDSYTPLAGSFGSSDESTLADIRTRAASQGFRRLVVLRDGRWDEVALDQP